MKEIPHSWTRVTLSDVGVITTGNTPSTKQTTNYGGEIPFVKPGDLDGRYPILKTEQSLSESGAQQARLLRKGAVLVSCIGNLGKVGIAGVPLTTNQQINAIEFEPLLVHDRFGYHYCKTLREWMENEASATTVTILNKSKFSKAPFSLAPLNEQKRIADKLDALLARVDACRTRLDRIPLILKRFRQSVLAAATSGQLTEDWRMKRFGIDSETEDMIGFDYYDADCFGDYSFPASWRVSRLGEIAEVIGGITKDSKKQNPADEELPYLRVANVQRGFLDLSEIKRIRVPQQRVDELLLRQGDILFTEGGDLDKLGRGWIWSDAIDRCTFQNHIFRARLRDANFEPKFFSWYGNSRGFDYFLAFGKQTTNLASINKTLVSALPVAVPPGEEQREIVRRVETLFAFTDRLEVRHQTARTQVEQLTPALLAKAFRGELVPQDPEDEPASVLLERIQAARAAAPAQPKSTRRRSAMSNQNAQRAGVVEPIAIAQALRKSGKELSSTELLLAAGYPNNADSESIEHFLVAVRAALRNNEITRQRRGDTDWFALATE